MWYFKGTWMKVRKSLKPLWLQFRCVGNECLWRKTKNSTVSKLLQRLGESKYMIHNTSRSLEWKEIILTSVLCNSSDSPKGAPRPCYPVTLGCPWDGVLLKSLGKHFQTRIRKEVRGGEEGKNRKENERRKGWKYGSSPSFTLVSEMKLTWSVKTLQNVVKLRCQVLPSWHGAWHTGSSLINC